MCGIAGMLGLAADPQIAESMLSTMSRRGPDGNGVYRKDDCCLLHSRLAVIDPVNGKQPMVLDYGDERYILVYNGELYNTSELREELMKLGHQFHSHSDSEVLLHAYAQFGKTCVDHMNGIYAFAVWEEKRRRLFLARDRIGVKPLFYMHHKGGFLFSSEIKTLLKYPSVQPELDGEGVMQILMLGPGRIPGSGVFHNIYELESGYRGYWEQGRWRPERYWYLKDREHRDDFETTAEKTRALVIDAIRRQMVSDVPIGTFLSGGLDSSLISAVCAGEMKAKNKILPTFSVDYLNNDQNFHPSKFQPNSDGEYIRLMEATLQTEHHWTILSPEDLMENLEAATIARDLPGMADVDFSLLAFSKEIRKDVKVALSGECADEIFGGYPWYRDPEVRNQAGFPWAQNTEKRLAMLHPSFRDRVDGQSYVMDLYKTTCRESDILPETAPAERRMKEMMNLNFRWFMQTLLDRKDRMSMYHSLEVRVPFCDYRIAEYLYSVPWEYKVYQGKEKGLLRHALEGIVPDAVLWRKKSPYPKTFDHRYTQKVADRLEFLLQDQNAPLFMLVDRKVLEQLYDDDFSWPWYGQLMGKPQTMAYFLQLDFWLREYQVRIL